MQVVAGNVATAQGAQALVQAGCDAVKVGIGPGSICTTRIVAGVGVPQLSAIDEVSRAIRDSRVPVIADGGVRFSGDAAKALAAGGHSVMVGSLFAGTEESPGEVELYQGRSYKSYRGMGSLGRDVPGPGLAGPLLPGHDDRARKARAGGHRGAGAVQGPARRGHPPAHRRLRASLGYTGCRDLREFREKARFVRLTGAGMRESHVHDVNVTKEAPNYRAG